MNFLQVINLKNSPSFTLILYAIYKKFQLSLVSRFWFVSHINSTFFDQNKKLIKIGLITSIRPISK